MKILKLFSTTNPVTASRIDKSGYIIIIFQMSYKFKKYIYFIYIFLIVTPGTYLTCLQQVGVSQMNI